MLNKEKILAGVRACINPHISICQDCPYWNNGDKQCEELRMDIVEAIDSGVFAPHALPTTAEWIPDIVFCESLGKNLILQYICSACEDTSDNAWNYCPNCGAKMTIEGEII